MQHVRSTAYLLRSYSVAMNKAKEFHINSHPHDVAIRLEVNVHAHRIPRPERGGHEHLKDGGILVHGKVERQRKIPLFLAGLAIEGDGVDVTVEIGTAISSSVQYLGSR